MLGVCIVTYNQERYIAEAIESVLTQADCGHRVVAYIGNDCSTDRTGKICHQYADKYPDKIKVFDNQKNLGLVGNTMNLLDAMRNDGCEFIAMLDGDDYWSNDHKLQKQIAYMDIHPEYGLVHTYVDLLCRDGIHCDTRGRVMEGDVFSVIENYQIGNCSVVFRTELLNMIDFEEFQQQGLKSCDYSMYAIFASGTLFGFVPEHTAVWRRDIESVSGSANIERQIAYYENDLAHWRYLAKLFPERWNYTEEAGAAHFHKRAFNVAFRAGDKKRALAEASLMCDNDKKTKCFKIFCAHSSILMWLWNKMRV